MNGDQTCSQDRTFRRPTPPRRTTGKPEETATQRKAQSNPVLTEIDDDARRARPSPRFPSSSLPFASASTPNSWSPGLVLYSSFSLPLSCLLLSLALYFYENIKPESIGTGTGTGTGGEVARNVETGRGEISCSW